MLEVPALPDLLHAEANGVVANAHGREHLLHGRAREHAIRFAGGESGCSNELSAIPIGSSTSSRMISANGRFRASANACCMSVTPPPEYSISVIGGRSMNSGPTVDDGCPPRIWTTVGRGAEGS